MSAEGTLRTNNGFTLIEVMIGLAILAAIALTFGSTFFQIHNQSAKAEALMVVDNTTKAIQAIFANRDLCDNALRDSTNGKITFTPATQPVEIGKIMYTSTLVPSQSSVAFTEKQRLSPNVILDSIYFAEQKPGFGESQIKIGKNSTFGNYVSGTYNIYTGFLTLNFASPNDSATAGKTLPQRQIPLVVAANASNRIDYCYINLSQWELCIESGGDLDANGACTNTVYQKFVNKGDCTAANSTPCPHACPNPYDAYTVNGFNSDGSPVCICQETCDTNPWPPSSGGGGFGGSVGGGSGGK